MIKTYNYKKFKPQKWDQTPYTEGLACHEKFPMDATVLDEMGRTVSLKKFAGQRFVIETGSLTCPHYIQNIESMNTLAKGFNHIPFFVLYVREEHPGEILPKHVDNEQKHDRAYWVQSLENETRPVYIDNVNGSLHQKIGSYPNIIYVVDELGHVEFKRFWNNPQEIEEHLADIAKLKSCDMPTVYPPQHVSFRTTFRTLMKSGPQAFITFIKSRFYLFKSKYFDE